MPTCQNIMVCYVGNVGDMCFDNVAKIGCLSFGHSGQYSDIQHSKLKRGIDWDFVLKWCSKGYCIANHSHLERQGFSLALSLHHHDLTCQTMVQHRGENNSSPILQCGHTELHQRTALTTVLFLSLQLLGKYSIYLFKQSMVEWIPPLVSPKVVW